MNVLHWRIADSHSFPLELKAFPAVSKMASYSPSQVYTADDVKDIMDYAKVRGVQVIPEISVPTHASLAWKHSGVSDDEMVLCDSWPEWSKYCPRTMPCTQLNIVNHKTMATLKTIFTEIVTAFQTNLVHVGGDSTNFRCWNESTAIQRQFRIANVEPTDSSLVQLLVDFLKFTKKLVPSEHALRWYDEALPPDSFIVPTLARASTSLQ